jgi:hypothetical protein
MTINKKTSSLLYIFLFSLLLVIAGLAHGKESLDQHKSASGSQKDRFVAKPIPMDMEQWNAKLYELIVQGEIKYSPPFSDSFQKLLEPINSHDKNAFKKITSGPATSAQYFKLANNKEYIHYSICQAYRCDATHLDVIYSPKSMNMVAALVYSCKLVLLGQPDMEEKILLSKLSRKWEKPAKRDCQE